MTITSLVGGQEEGVGTIQLGGYADGPNSDRQRSLRVSSDYNRPEKITSMVPYLCGDVASAITGDSLPINGGANI